MIPLSKCEHPHVEEYGDCNQCRFCDHCGGAEGECPDCGAEVFRKGSYGQWRIKKT